MGTSKWMANHLSRAAIRHAARAICLGAVSFAATARAQPGKNCKLIEQPIAVVQCSNGRIYRLDEEHAVFKRGAVAAICSYRTVGVSREAFFKNLRERDLLHFANGEELECYESRSIHDDGEMGPPAPIQTRTVVQANGDPVPRCPPGQLMIAGQCLKPQETKFHNNPNANELIKRIAHKFYRSNFICPGKAEFVALSGLNQVLTSSPIPGAGDGVNIATLIAPLSVDVSATGVDPRLPVSCGYNNEAETTYRASFFCNKSGACFQQGDDSLPHDCEAFGPTKKGIGVQFWEHKGGDCSSVRRFKNGGEEGTFALRELGPGIFIRIVQDNWDDAFYHGLIFSKDPSVIEFWRSDED